MSEIKITKNSLENAILKDGNFVSGYVGSGYIDVSGNGNYAAGYIYVQDGSITAIGNGAHAEGCIDGMHNHILAIGNGAHAEGYVRSTGAGVDAFGNGAHAEGIGTRAIADGAHAEGAGTKALAIYSHAEGWLTTAFGPASHAEGYQTEAGKALINTGLYSTGIFTRPTIITINQDPSNIVQVNDIINYNNVDFKVVRIHTSPYTIEVKGDICSIYTQNASIFKYDYRSYSHSEGWNTKAIGTASHAGGRGTIADRDAMTAIGKYNQNTNTENTLFVVGDGSSGANADRSDAFRVNSLGSEINSVPSSVQAKVNGISDVYLGCPIGTVVMWAGGQINDKSWNASTEAPDGWLICDGRVIPTTDSTYTTASSDYEDFQNLLNVIGTKYGKAYITVPSTFAPRTVKNEPQQRYTYYVHIPNFAQKFPLGSGYVSGKDNIHELDKNYFKFEAGNETYYSNNGSTGGEASHTLTKDEITKHITSCGGTGTNVFAEDTANPLSHNNIPPFLAINFIIKYK